MNPENIFDTWELGNSYERYIGRWSRKVAPVFLSWLNIPAGRRWLDVGCGTGALCASIVDQSSPAIIMGVEPSHGLLMTAKQILGQRVLISQGTATAIPLVDSLVDAVVSGLVLNFVPDQRAALREMARVTVTGGSIAAYVWDYAEKMEFLRIFWDSAISLDPDIKRLDEGERFPMCHPQILLELFTSAGLYPAEVTAIDIPTQFESFNDFWQPFWGGQGPAPGYVLSLQPAAQERLRDHLRKRLPIGPDGAISLIARAWAIRAKVAK